MMNILGLIPARANSKRVPGKNLREINGKALVHYVMEAAIKSNVLSEVVLSSDSPEILQLAKPFGNQIVSVNRPAEISRDDSPAIDYVVHALEYMKFSENKIFDAVCIIQPSSPLTNSNDIDNTIQLMIDYEADCAVSIREVPYDLQPSKYLFLKQNKLHSFLTEEQKLQLKDAHEKMYVRNGSVYVSKMELIVEGKILSDNCAAYIMPAERSVDINDELDLLFAEFLLKNKTKGVRFAKSS